MTADFNRAASQIDRMNVLAPLPTLDSRHNVVIRACAGAEVCLESPG